MKRTIIAAALLCLSFAGSAVGQSDADATNCVTSGKVFEKATGIIKTLSTSATTQQGLITIETQDVAGSKGDRGMFRRESTGSVYGVITAQSVTPQPDGTLRLQATMNHTMAFTEGMGKSDVTGMLLTYNDSVAGTFRPGECVVPVTEQNNIVVGTGQMTGVLGIAIGKGTINVCGTGPNEFTTTVAVCRAAIVRKS